MDWINNYSKTLKQHAVLTSVGMKHWLVFALSWASVHYPSCTASIFVMSYRSTSSSHSKLFVFLVKVVVSVRRHCFKYTGWQSIPVFKLEKGNLKSLLKVFFFVYKGHICPILNLCAPRLAGFLTWSVWLQSVVNVSWQLEGF